MQSGAYPDPAPAGDIAPSDPFIFEPTCGAVSQLIVCYSAVSAFCGLPGCATTYSKLPAIKHVPVTPSAPPLTVTHEVVSLLIRLVPPRGPLNGNPLPHSIAMLHDHLQLLGTTT